MKAIHPLARAMFGFLFGVIALLTPFVLLATMAVLRANVSHGTQSADDYRFGAAAIVLLTGGFAGGAALLGHRALAGLPARVAAIAGAGAMTLVLIAIMVIGKPLGFGGALAVAAGAGALAASLVFRAWRAPQPLEAERALRQTALHA